MNRSQISRSTKDVPAADASRAGKSGVSMPAVPVLQQKAGQEQEEQPEFLQLKSFYASPAVSPFRLNEPVQKKANNTGLPDNLKTGVENLSGFSMDDVKVHYNSAQPAQLQAHAYAQGTDIHLAPGQEEHLPHEAWHVVQQKQGRVQATMQMKTGIAVNDDKGLENEADVMGLKAKQLNYNEAAGSLTGEIHNNIASANNIQLKALVVSTTNSLVVQREEEDTSDDKLESVIAKKQPEGIPGVNLTKPLKYQRWRKLNRIGGDLKKQALVSLNPIVTKLETVFTTIENTDPLNQKTDIPAAVTEVDEKCEEIIVAKALPGADISMAEFEAYSTFGPLNFWLHNQVSTGTIQTGLKTLRLKLAQRDTLSVVAHRGSGPTNRTRGGLIVQDDPRRLTRPAENSTSAFKAALNSVEATGAPGLDGVECDVFLSKDNKAILSHEGAVKEQLSTAQKHIHDALVKDNTHIDDLTEAELLTIKRTEKADSNFITLRGLLDQSVEVAKKYNTDTNNPFRIEIEMKGKSSKADAGYGARLTKVVAKEISKFKKANPKVFIEFIVFNGAVEDAQQYDAVRTKKSKLGSLYTGLGSDSVEKGKAAKADELRMPLSQVNIDKIAAFTAGGFITTLVPGAEHPLRDLDLNTVDKMEFKVLEWNPPIAASEIESAARTNELEVMKAELVKVAEWKKQAATPGKKPGPTKIKADAEAAYAAYAALNNIPLSLDELVTKKEKEIKTLNEHIKELNGEIKRRKAADEEMKSMGKKDNDLINVLVAKGAKVLASVHLLTDVPENAGAYKAKVTEPVVAQPQPVLGGPPSVI